jgi:CheY-like chemotaxis protein
MNKNKIVLIIDDDDDDRALFSDALKEINNSIKYLSAKSGMEGLALLKNEKIMLPDLIFLDLNMPTLNGKQCLTEIKKDPKLIHIPVVVYSTTKRLEDIEEVKKLGAVYFLTKPVLFKDICSAIKMLLNVKWGKNIPH